MARARCRRRQADPFRPPRQRAQEGRDTRDTPSETNSIGLLSRCLGGNSTIHAMSYFPQYFQDIQAMVLLQAVSGHAFVEKGALNAGLDVDQTVVAFDQHLHELTGFRLKELDPTPLAKNVKVPTMVVQVRRDTLIDTKNTQEIFDALGSSEKQLIWIEDTDRRFDGYNYFSQKPAELLAWFGKYVEVKEAGPSATM